MLNIRNFSLIIFSFLHLLLISATQNNNKNKAHVLRNKKRVIKRLQQIGNLDNKLHQDLCGLIASITGCALINRNATFDNVNVINSLSATDLFIANCIDNLCVDNLSLNNVFSDGILHNDPAGTISSSLIVNDDIENNTIANSKLAAISSNNIPDTIVIRDIEGNFAAHIISLDGVVSNQTDVATKEYVDLAIASNSNHFSIEEYTVIEDNQTFNAAPTTSILLLSSIGDITNLTIIFPVSPINGQLFTIVLTSDYPIEIFNDGNINNGNPAPVIHGITTLDGDMIPTESAGGVSVTYIYSVTTNSWYRYSRG